MKSGLKYSKISKEPKPSLLFMKFLVHFENGAENRDFGYT